VRPSELVALLQEFYRERLALKLRHVAGAQFVSRYEVNNTYQYVIAREDVQLGWVRDAITEMGAAVPEDVGAPEPPEGKGEARAQAIFRDDAQRAAEFVERWRDRIERVTHARHRKILRVILGETLEHKRFFEQAAAGRLDLLGRRTDGVPASGQVLGTRWLE
jgi:hypothetical protein